MESASCVRPHNAAAAVGERAPFMSRLPACSITVEQDPSQSGDLVKYTMRPDGQSLTQHPLTMVPNVPQMDKGEYKVPSHALEQAPGSAGKSGIT
jgi:hypothetical protein